MMLILDLKNHVREILFFCKKLPILLNIFIWFGRVNRKDQVIAPIVTNLNTVLLAGLRLTMMDNSKLRQFSPEDEIVGDHLFHLLMKMAYAKEAMLLYVEEYLKK